MIYHKEKIKYVLITGCSSGIGYETAKYLKDNKFEVIVSSRKKVAQNLSSSPEVTVVCSREASKK